MVRMCQVCKKNSRNYPNLSFHSFPTDHETRRIWFALLHFDVNQVLPKRPEVCSDHFEVTDFHYKTSGRKFLNKDANPKPYQPEYEFNEGFPHDLSARSLWISLLGLDNTQVITKNTFLCSEHFEPGDVLLKINESKYIKSGALPKLSHPFFERSFRSKTNETDNIKVNQLDYVSVEPEVDPMLNENKIKIEEDYLEARIARKELIILNEEPAVFQKESNIFEDTFSISHEAQIKSKGPVFSQEEPNNFKETSKIFHGAQIQSSSHIRIFFNGIAQTVISFPPSLAIRAKVEVLRVISDLELELLSRKNEQSGV